MSDECLAPSCTQHTQDLLKENAQLRRHLRAMQQSMRGIMLQLQAQMSALPLDTVYSLDKFDDFYPSTVSSEDGMVREVQLESKSSDLG
ncbi:MAG: hypothetical protein KVP17_003628 [Porospora cf. gigantea B]|nr:MAG: hypothetical protein KVP17_003628 [Porospora cf. gigantea B]